MNDFDKQYKELLSFIEESDCSYNTTSKREFARKSKAFLETIKEKIEFDEVIIHYNPGGVAVWGDAWLMGMKNGKGVHIYVTESAKQWGVLYRSIKDMKDYSGGNNNWDHKNGANMLLEKINRLLEG